MQHGDLSTYGRRDPDHDQGEKSYYTWRASVDCDGGHHDIPCSCPWWRAVPLTTTQACNHHTPPPLPPRPEATEAEPQRPGRPRLCQDQ